MLLANRFSFFSKQCFFCGKSIVKDAGHYCCADCLKLTQPIRFEAAIHCSKCGTNIYQSSLSFCFNCSRLEQSYYRNTSLYYYKNPIIRELMHRFKFQSEKMAGIDLARLIKDEILLYLQTNNYDIITIAPVSAKTFRKRGFNQVGFILEQLKIPYDQSILRRKHDRHQSQLNALERRELIKDQFYIPEHHRAQFENKSVLLIDDIFTTGSTAHEISTMLMHQQAKQVDVLTFFKD